MNKTIKDCLLHRLPRISLEKYFRSFLRTSISCNILLHTVG